MHRLFSTVGLFLILSALSFGASSTGGKTILSPGVALPIGVDTGETAVGVSFGVLTPTDISPKFYWGGDFGLHFWGKVYSATESTTAFQFLPTVVYFGGSGGNLSPFIGLSAGPYWYVAQAAGAPGIDFLLLFRPGLIVNVGQTTKLWVEAKYGSLGGAFIVMPTVSLSISL